MKPWEVGLLAPAEEIAARVAELSKEITRGWMVYGKFLDCKKTDLLPAKEILEVIQKMEAERAELGFMLKPNDASLFLGDNESYLDKHT